MENQPKKPWQALCEEAANEENPERLMKLVQEISQMLDQQFKQQQPEKAA